MSTEDRVGIVIPAYNAGLFVIEAAESAESSLGSKTNVIIVDDGSTDSTSRDALRALEDRGFRVLRQPNSGVSVARNMGLAALSVPYAMTLDADDLIHPTAPSAAADVLDVDSAIVIVTGPMIEFDNLGSQWHYSTSPNATRDGMRHETKIHIVSAFRLEDWRRTEGFPPGIKYGEDWVFWMRLLGLGGHIHRAENTFFLRRRHSEQVTARYIDPVESSKARMIVMRENPDLVAGHIDEFIDSYMETLTTLAAYRRAYRLADSFKRKAQSLLRNLGPREIYRSDKRIKKRGR